MYFDTYLYVRTTLGSDALQQLESTQNVFDTEYSLHTLDRPKTDRWHQIKILSIIYNQNHFSNLEKVHNVHKKMFFFITNLSVPLRHNEVK